LSSVPNARVLVAGALAVIALAIWLHPGTTRAVGQDIARGSNDPNVIVVMVDDQALNTFSKERMPHTFALTQGGTGTQLRGYASPPLCCPARAGFLTGQYPHNHGVLQNDWRFLKEPDNTLPAWLQNAGYSTGFVGKYLNEYAPAPAPAGGWDSWFELMQPTGYFNYSISNQGIVETAGEERENYSTTVVTKESQDFIREEAESPFFLWTSYFAPHVRNSKDAHCRRDAPTLLPGAWRDVRNEPVVLSDSFNEANVSDKPKRVRRREPLSENFAAHAADRIRCTYAAMQEVDAGVHDIRETLRELGIDDDTVIFYVSDNGYFFGEHRIAKGKGLPYVETVRVPMIVHVPRKILGGDIAHISEPVANIDLAPTILDLADAEPCTESGDCRIMDGRSIVGLMEGNDGRWPNHRPIGVHLKKQCVGYEGVYRGKETYIRWYGRVHGDCRTPEKELYDLRDDPSQLQNRLFGDPTEEARDDAARLDKLVDRLTKCSGIEGRDPQQAGLPFC
jgi:arylsulfatase A-like enzyme